MGSQHPLPASALNAFGSRYDRAIGWNGSAPIGARPRPSFARSWSVWPNGTAFRKKDINYAIDGYADDMLSDLVYSVERDLEHENEERSAP